MRNLKGNKMNKVKPKVNQEVSLNHQKSPTGPLPSNMMNSSDTSNFSQLKTKNKGKELVMDNSKKRISSKLGLDKKNNLVISTSKLKIQSKSSTSKLNKKSSNLPKVGSEMKSSINSINSFAEAHKKKYFKIETNSVSSPKINQKNTYANTNTRYSTKNTDNSNSAGQLSPISKDEFFYNNLIDNTVLNDREKNTYSEYLKNDFPLKKIYESFTELLSTDYDLTSLKQNDELKKDFIKLRKTVESLASGGAVNANMLNMLNQNEELVFGNEINSSILYHSTGRKVVYNTFFEYFQGIIQYLNDLASKYQINSLYKIKEESGKIEGSSSLHSVINFEKNESGLTNNNILSKMSSSNNNKDNTSSFRMRT